MLYRSVKMNLEICRRNLERCVGWLVAAFIAPGFLTIAALAAAFVYLLLACRDLFDRSMFDDEAYTYMMVPVSMRHVVLGKAIAANLCMVVCIAAIIMEFTLDKVLEAYGTGVPGNGMGMYLLQELSGVYVAAEDGVVAVGEVIYDKGQLMAMAVEVVLLPVGLLSGGMFLFGVFQLASVIRHMLDPQRRSAVVTAGTVVSSIVAMLAVSAALFALESAVTGGDYTVFGVIIYMAVPAALGAVCIIIAMSLMDNRYSIC